MQFTWLKNFKRRRLKAQLEKERLEHIKQQKKQALASFEVNAQMGNFADNKAVLDGLKSELENDDFIQLEIKATHIESKALEKKFYASLKAQEFEEAESVLADIHVRVDDEAYKKYEEKLFKAKEPKGFDRFVVGITSFFESVKDTAQSITEGVSQVSLENVKGLGSKVQKTFKQATDHKEAFKQTEELLNKKSEQEAVSIEELPEENVSGVESIFGVTQHDEKDILDSILQGEKQEVEEQAEQKAEGGSDEKFHLVGEEEEEHVQYVNPFVTYTVHAYKIMIVSVMFLALSWIFFFVQFDEKNMVLGMLGQKNLFVQGADLADEAARLKRQINVADVRMEQLAQGSVDVPSRVALEEIRTEKIDWLGLREDLQEATLSAFPYNNLLNYIRYNSFQGDTKKETVSISGIIEDPSGRVFSMVSRLVRAINTHPSFSGATMKTFSKDRVDDGEGGEVFSTSFSLTLTYHREHDIEEGNQ